MKKVIIIIAGVVFLTVGFFACRQNRPEDVVEKYFTHFCRGEYTEVQKYVTAEHRDYYEVLEGYYSVENDTVRKSQIKVKDIKCKITADTVAICSCTVQEENRKSKEQIIQLKKVGKEWLVNQGKENGMFIDKKNNKSDENEDNAFSYDEMFQVNSSDEKESPDKK
jgi:hypothetical protein